MQFVPGEGPTPCDLMFVGEGPGVEEDQHGRPFVGKSGRELNRYIWHSIQRTRTSVYVTNLVKYRVPGDGDPTGADIARDAGILAQELVDVDPQVVVTLGRWSTRNFIHDADMETVHGIPHWVDGRVVFPIIHPAAGLHSTEFQGTIAWDFEQLGKLLRGEDVQWAAEDEYPATDYRENSGWTMIGGTQAVDTEGSVAKPWCLSHTGVAGAAVCNRIGGTDFQHVVLHNALHDIGVLRSMKASYDRFDDTMVMAYLLCVEPQGLKALAKRHCGMEMSSYDEITGEASRRLALEWLELASRSMRSKEHGEEPTGRSTKRKSSGGKGGAGRRRSESTAVNAVAAARPTSGFSRSSTKRAGAKRTVRHSKITGRGGS